MDAAFSGCERALSGASILAGGGFTGPLRQLSAVIDVIGKELHLVGAGVKQIGVSNSDCYQLN